MPSSDGRNEARSYFKRKGLKYTSNPAEFIAYPIGEDDIFVLYRFCVEEIKRDKKAGGFSKTCDMRMSKKIVFKYNGHGMACAYLYVNSNYFTQREAISFNSDGFIGFAGWAADESVKPFISAFNRWVDWFVRSYGEVAMLNSGEVA